MKKITVRLVLLAAVAFALHGCVTFWTKVEPETRVARNASFSVELPVGWMRFEPASNQLEVTRQGKRETVKADRILITRDVLNLHRIDLMRLASADAFPHIKRTYSSTMLPSEAAELLMADLRAVPGLDNLTVVRNAPRVVAGQPGFEVEVTYKNEKGLQFRRVVYAFGDAGAFYTFTYDAPALHYFDLHRVTFDRVVDSFRPNTQSAKAGG